MDFEKGKRMVIQKLKVIGMEKLKVILMGSHLETLTLKEIEKVMRKD